MSNSIKNIATILLIVIGLVLYQYLDNQMMSVRVLVFLVSLVLAVLVFSTTTLGDQSKELLSNARIELRKIKWADKKSTGQMTLIVFLAVFLIGLFLWLVDSLIFRILQWIIN